MAYTPIPTESKSQINRAGKLLAKGDADDHTLEQALDLANRWRACHAYPINTFQATLRTKTGNFKGEHLVAQRLKRMPTVIDKLRREPAMPLYSMQDLAGVRAILDSMSDVDKLVEKYVDNKNFPHKLIKHNDYIRNPRDKDGYRSVHLIYNYHNKTTPDFNGLNVEIQIRTRLQHIWATAVETMGTFIGQALKSKQGDAQWLDFFALLSSAFAYLEGTPPIRRFEHLSEIETFERVAKEESELGVLSKIDSLSTIAEEVENSKSYFYHLIVMNYEENSRLIKAFDRDSYLEAIEEYNKQESEMADVRSDVVLVSAGRIGTLKKAYPNLFLDLSEFEHTLMMIIATTDHQAEAVRKEMEP